MAGNINTHPTIWSLLSPLLGVPEGYCSIRLAISYLAILHLRILHLAAHPLENWVWVVRVFWQGKEGGQLSLSGGPSELPDIAWTVTVPHFSIAFSLSRHRHYFKEGISDGRNAETGD